MKKYILAAALVTLMSGSAFAQAGTTQGDTIVPNPSQSASSNDRSKNPSASIRDSESQSMMSANASTTAHVKKHKKP